MGDKARTSPPLLAIEILSPDDRMNRVIKRLEEFLYMGTEHVWLLDPVERVAYTYSDAGLKLVGTPRIEIAASPIYLDLNEIFSAFNA